MKDKLRHTEPRFLCECVAKELDLPTKGRRNVIGSFLPSRGSSSLNGGMPGITAAGRDNNDIKCPYRLPTMRATCDAACKGTCFTTKSTAAIIEAVDTSQSAQVGHHCDYSNKRQPVGMHECREWSKGHRDLACNLQGETLGYATKRHAQRIISDCFARGVLRTSNETAKLNDAVGHAECTHAEVTCTAPFGNFPGESFLSVVEERCSLKLGALEKGLVQARKQKNNEEPMVLVKRMGLLYGYRGRDPDLQYLSPYEFVRHWCVQNLRGSQDNESTDIVKRFDPQVAPAELVLNWVMTRRQRPVVPVFHGCPMPKVSQGFNVRTARILFCYFHPWTLDNQSACDVVPAATAWKDGEGWVQRCRQWLCGRILTEEMRRVLTNFLSANRVRPREQDVEADHSDEQLSDEECVIEDGDLDHVLITRPGGKPASQGRDSHHENAVSAIARVQEVWGEEVRQNQKKQRTTLQAVLASPWNAKEMCQAARKRIRDEVVTFESVI